MDVDDLVERLRRRERSREGPCNWAKNMPSVRSEVRYD